jgi:hypothetical protein
VQNADEGDTTTIQQTLPESAEQLDAVAAVTDDAVAVISAPTSASPIAGHSRGLIKTPNGVQCTRIAGVSEAPAANGSCADAENC